MAAGPLLPGVSLLILWCAQICSETVGKTFGLLMAVFPEHAFKDHGRMSCDWEAEDKKPSSLTFPCAAYEVG